MLKDLIVNTWELLFYLSASDYQLMTTLIKASMLLDADVLNYYLQNGNDVDYDYAQRCLRETD